LAFRLYFRGRLLSVEVTDDTATYTLLAGKPMALRHYDETCTVDIDQPASAGLPARPHLDPPRQPAGRAPRRRTLK
jgi:alpha,alpha-trehalose phosphorylase